MTTACDRMGSQTTSIADLTHDPRNARKHNPRNIGGIVNALHKVGAARSIVIDENNVILAGNGLVEAAGEAGIERVRVVDADGQTVVAVRRTGLTKKQKAELAILDNRTAELAEWDVPVLTGLADEVGLDLNSVEFTAAELARLGAEDDPAEQDDVPGPEEADPLREKWGTAAGQLWLIPSADAARTHRLLVGDSHDDASVARALDNVRPGVVVLDPPYDAAFDKLWVRHIADPCIVFGQAKHVRQVPADLWRFERVVDKGRMHRSTHTHVGHRHAFVVQCGTTKTCPAVRDTFPSVVAHEWDFDFDYAKPVPLLVEHLTHWTAPWEVVFDPYAGSGSTFVAAERMGRAARGIEFDPGRAAIILERLSGIGLSPVPDGGGQAKARTGRGRRRAG